MPGLVPGIRVLAVQCKKDVDGRDEPGHDGKHTLRGRLIHFRPWNKCIAVPISAI